jgi:uncharacterized Zn finger protein (UPF0148 family)
MPEGKSPDLCPRCGDALIAGKLYCANCGLAIVALPERVAIDAYVEAKVSQALASRLSDQTSLVREIGDKAEDVVWTRLKRYTWAVGIFLFLMGLYGVSSIQQAKSKIVDEAHSRLEPVIEDTEKRVSAAQTEIGKSEEQIGSVKKKLDETSTLADHQSERLTVQGGEIETKLARVQAASQRATLLSSGYDKRAAEFESHLAEMQTRAEQSDRRLADIQKSFDTRIAAVTRQVDDVSVSQAFPGLGQKLYVTYNNKPWRNPSEKKPGEIWVDIYVETQFWPNISPKQMEDLGQDLRGLGLTPFFGTFGVGGSYASGFGSLGDDSTAVFYFNEKGQQQASVAAKAVMSHLKLDDMPTKYIDPAKVDRIMRPVLEQSGLDMQIYISAPRK